MGISYLTCHHCGEIFSDWEEYVWCDCDNVWCDEECAAIDGYVDKHCTKYDAYGRDALNNARIEHKCDKKYCDIDCEFYVEDSCGFCREEKYEDRELLEKALDLLQMTEDELIQKMK